MLWHISHSVPLSVLSVPKTVFFDHETFEFVLLFITDEIILFVGRIMTPLMTIFLMLTPISGPDKGLNNYAAPCVLSTLERNLLR
jgi:hypothetical protein